MVRTVIASLTLTILLSGCGTTPKAPPRDLTPAEEVAILESLDTIPVR